MHAYCWARLPAFSYCSEFVLARYSVALTSHLSSQPASFPFAPLGIEHDPGRDFLLGNILTGLNVPGIHFGVIEVPQS